MITTKRLLITALIFILVAPTVFKASAGKSEKIAFTKTETIIRKKPFERAEKIYTVKQGKALRVLEERDEWLKVKRLKSRTGWVKRSFVNILEISQKKKKRMKKYKTHFTADEISIKLDIQMMVGDKGVLNDDLYLKKRPGKRSRRSHRFVKDFGVTVVAEKGNWIKVKDEIGRSGWITKNMYTSLKPPPEVDISDADVKRDEGVCKNYLESVCNCYGQGSVECLRSTSKTQDALSRDREVALEVCEEKFATFSCVETEMLVTYHLEKCPDTQGKDFRPLKYKTGRCTMGENYFKIQSVWGTSDKVLPGETFIVEGVYALHGKKKALIEFGPNGGSSRPCRQDAEPGKGKFAVAALVVYAEDEDANELQLAYIKPHSESTALSPLACAIKIIED